MGHHAHRAHESTHTLVCVCVYAAYGVRRRAHWWGPQWWGGGQCFPRLRIGALCRLIDLGLPGGAARPRRQGRRTLSLTRACFLYRGVVPKKLRPKYNKIMGRLALEKDDLEDAVEDVKDAAKAGLNPADVRTSPMTNVLVCQCLLRDICAQGMIHLHVSMCRWWTTASLERRRGSSYPRPSKSTKRRLTRIAASSRKSLPSFPTRASWVAGTLPHSPAYLCAHAHRVSVRGL